MNAIVKIIGVAFIAGPAAYVLIPEFRFDVNYQFVRIFVSPPQQIVALFFLGGCLQVIVH